MAHKKGAGSTHNGRDSRAKYLGLKCCQFQKVLPGFILIRQRGTLFNAGKNVKQGKDYTLYSLIQGIVNIKKNIISVI